MAKKEPSGEPDLLGELAVAATPKQAVKAASRRPRKTAGQSTTAAKSDDAGADLERRVARIEFAEGAFVRLRTPVRAPQADPGRRILTDVDVLSLDIDLRLRVTLGITECKTERGQAGETDRLFWLSGLKLFASADRATLCRPTSSTRGLSVARVLGVRLLDGATLEARELANAWLPQRFGHVGGAWTSHAAVADRQLKDTADLPALLVFLLQHEHLTTPSHRVVNALLSLGSYVRGGVTLPEPSRQILASDALVALTLAAIRDAGALDALPISELRQRLSLAVTVGNPFDRHILDVLKDADALVGSVIEELHSKYTDHGAARQTIEVPSLHDLVGSPPEAEIDTYLGLVERMRAVPSIARELPQTIELACFEALLDGKEWNQPCFDHLFTPEHGNLLDASLRVLAVLVGEPLASCLDSVRKLDFSRRAPGVPDRRTSPGTAQVGGD